MDPASAQHSCPLSPQRQGLVFIQVEERGREFTPLSLVQLPAQLHQDKVLATLTRAAEPEVRAAEGERRGKHRVPWLTSASGEGKAGVEKALKATGFPGIWHLQAALPPCLSWLGVLCKAAGT